MLEQKYKSLPETERTKIKKWTEMLDARNKTRVLAGFSLEETLEHLYSAQYLFGRISK